MSRSSYKAFTLIEMLIVMGILIILMVIGVAAGRFAINRANDIAHQNAAHNLYQGLQSYFTDQGSYPVLAAPASLMSNELKNYIDMGAFKGGSEASYYYFVNATHQSSLVCVTKGGIGDVTTKGIYCDGNGFGDSTLPLGSGGKTGADVKDKDISADDTTGVYDAIKSGTSSVWNGKAWGTVTP